MFESSCSSLRFTGGNRRVVNFQVIPGVSFEFINALSFSNMTSHVLTARSLLKALLLHGPVCSFWESTRHRVKNEEVF